MKQIDYAEIRYNIPAKDPKGDAYVVGQALMPKFKHEFTIFGKERGKDASGNVRIEFANALDKNFYSEAEWKQAKSIVEKAKKALEITYGEKSLDSYSHSWSDVKLVVDKDLITLNLAFKGDVYENPEHARLYWAIKGGSFPIVASSLEELKTSPRPKRFVLVEPNEDLEMNVEDDLTKDKATAALVKIFESGSYDDLFYIHKNLISADSGITKQASKELMYSNLSKFLKGEFAKTSKKSVVKDFNKVIKEYETSRQTLVTRAYINDAIYYQFITTDANNRLKNSETKTIYGSTVEDAVEYLNKASSEDELTNIVERVKLKWNSK